MQSPTSNAISQGKHGQFNAVDYRAKDRNNQWNKTFYAPEDGKITAYGVSGTCGNRLELTAGANRHGFCHLERSLVKVGQTVKKGQAIGVMGYTGYTIPAGVNGSHLHWVIYRNGVYVYPPSLVNEPFTVLSTSTGGNEVANASQVNNIYRGVLMREGDPGGVKNYTGRDANSIVTEMLNSAERKALEDRVKAHASFYNTYVGQIAELTSRPTKQQLEALGAQLMSKASEVAAVEAKLKELQDNPQVIEKEVIIEKNPGWLEAVIQFIRNVLKIK